MKKIFIPMFIILISFTSFSQKDNEVRASMGIDFINTPKLKDYLESLTHEQRSDFSSAVNFSASYGRMFGNSFQLQAEVGYLLSTINSSILIGQHELTYSIIMPTILSFAVLQGVGYNFKFGGGVGMRFFSVEESFLGNGSKEKYSSEGIGIVIRAEGNTGIAENVYAHIGADVRYDLLGKPDESVDSNRSGNVNFSSLSFGIRLGISYQF